MGCLTLTSDIDLGFGLHWVPQPNEQHICARSWDSNKGETCNMGEDIWAVIYRNYT